MAMISSPHKGGAMRRSIQLATLRFAVAVGEERSLLRASRRLGIHHSALSRRIRDLELALGVILFERHPGGVRATVAGDRFLATIRRILKDLDDALTRVEAAEPGRSGQPPIESDTLLCNCTFLNAVVAFMGAEPDIAAFVAFLRERYPSP
ncbi:LysR family transcriptional regulator [Mesorhizobium sp. M1142]|uniref:LysR family transcriptional regulator n=1 Tax=Mesorhizobium sp. M1142 TaxID=2957060 RepID=UPI003335BC3A